MKKITKLMLTLALLLVGVTGAKADTVVDAEVDFSKFEDGDASTIKFYNWGASDEAKARLSIKNGCLHFESTEATDPSWACQFFPIGGVIAEEGVTYTLHFKVKGSVAQNISALGFGQNPYGQFPITTEWVEGTFDYTAAGENPEGDIVFQCGNYVGEWDIAYLRITHELAAGTQAVDRWLACDGVAHANNWDRQATYSFTTPLEKDATYVVSADIYSVEGGECSLWSLWEASPNKNEWGGTTDVQYLSGKTVNNTITTYTWEFTASWPNDKISFVFGTIDGKICFDNVSCKKKNTDTELIFNGDFSGSSINGWNNTGNTTFTLETVSTEPPKPTVWTTILDNDPRCFRSKEYPDGSVLPVKINDNGEFVVNAPALAEYTWDSQFWIRLPQTLAAGKKFKVSFDYMASAAVSAPTQSHNEPGQYIHWACAGDVNFTTEWQTFNTTVIVPAECDGTEDTQGFMKDFRTIAFNLSQTDAVDFYFRNIKVEIDENDVTEPDYPADLYIVAGTEDLCGDGVSWDPRSMDNAMTLNSKTGLYVKTFENVAINSESYPKFRVVKNCSWSTAWPENDWVINTGTSGLFNITITYDPTNNEIAVDTEEIYTMTVAGNNTTLFGMAWDPTNTNNDLTKNEDGTFSITYEGKVLEEGQIIQFKVVKNHSWDVAYPEEDYQLNIPRSSNYDVTITFNPENKEVVATIKDNAVVSSYYLVGGEKDAAWTVGDVLTKDEDVYSIEIPYSSEYSFAIAPNTALNDLKNKVVNWNIVIRPVETTSVDFENVSGQVSTTDNSQNWTMVEKGNGEQKEFNALFSYDSKESTWTITASTTTTIGETGYATYSNAKPYTVEGATANFVTIPNRYAVLVPQDADAILPAMTGAGKNAGVILSGAGEVIINAVAKGAEATATRIDENLLAGSGNYPYGISTQFADNDPYTAYIFAQPEGKELGFYIADLNAGADLPAHKAFLAVPKGADAREFIGFEPGETTSIADNNRVTITNNGEVYNLNGQRVAQPTKGLYIVNGRKFVVK